MEHLILECSIRATLAALATGAILLLTRTKSAAARHAAWTGVVLLMLVLPLWTAWGPRPVLRVLTAPAAAAERTVFPAAARYPAIAEIPAVNNDAAPSGAFAVSRAGTSWSTWEFVLAIYAAGALLFLIRLAIGTAGARRLRRAAVESVRGTLISDACAAPVTTGWLRPVIILPARWSGWSRQQLDTVLAHEHAHARRRDPLVQWLALLNRAVFWFHPLAWWLERQLAQLAEEACDDAVLLQGHDPIEYAECLVAMERSVKTAGARLPAFVAAMPGNGLPRRIQLIFDGPRWPRMSKPRMLCIAAACATSAAVLGAVRLDHAVPLPLLPLPLSRTHDPSIEAIPSRAALPAKSARAVAEIIVAQATRPTPPPPPAPPTTRLEFEVATVKLAAPPALTAPPGGGPRPGQQGGGPGTADPERVRYRSMTLQTLLVNAYGLPVSQITGPAWIESERYDIVAKVPPGTTKEQVNVMLQSLVTDRFALRIHRETRELPVYELVAGKGASKMKAHVEDPGAPGTAAGELKLDTNGRPMPPPGEMIGILLPPGRWSFAATKQKIGGTSSSLVNLLARELGRPVIDKTGLTGEYDWSLEFRDTRPVRQSPGDPDAPEISVAVEEQLGLKLESRKGPVELLVVDSGNRTPSEN